MEISARLACLEFVYFMLYVVCLRYTNIWWYWKPIYTGEFWSAWKAHPPMKRFSTCVRQIYGLKTWIPHVHSACLFIAVSTGSSVPVSLHKTHVQFITLLRVHPAVIFMPALVPHKHYSSWGLTIPCSHWLDYCEPCPSNGFRNLLLSIMTPWHGRIFSITVLLWGIQYSHVDIPQSS